MVKFLHISDLHLGRSLSEHSLLSEQKFMLGQIIETVKTEKPDAVLIAGDIYDRGNPKGEVMQTFGAFLSDLNESGAVIIVISGNHDDPERVAYGTEILSHHSIHIPLQLTKDMEPIYLEDEFGKAAIYPVSFLTPAMVNYVYGTDDNPCKNMTEAMRAVIEHLGIDPAIRNILVAHQAVTGGEQSGSESMTVGGTEIVDAEVFAPFDYTALGHFHGAQVLSDGKTVYCGSPLKYSFNELNQKKSLTLVTLNAKGTLPEIKTIPVKPLRDLKELKGKYDELMDHNFVQRHNTDDYYRVILTDETMDSTAPRRLMTVYPNILEYRYENSTTKGENKPVDVPDVENLTPFALLSEFFRHQLNKDLTAQQTGLAQEHIGKIWGQ